MNNYIDLKIKNDNYFTSIEGQYNNIVNRKKIIAAYEKEAFHSKWQISSSKEKAKLILKKAAILLGAKKSLFLGGYRLEETFRQRLQDMEIYNDILQNKIGFQPGIRDCSKQQGSVIKENVILQTTNWGDNFKALLTKYKSYIALMVENLDAGGLEQVVACLASWFFENNIPVKVFCSQSGGKIEKKLQSEGIDVLVFHGKKSLFKNYLKNNPPLLINTHFVSDFYEIINQYQIPTVEVIHNMYVFLTDRQLKQERKKEKCITHYIAVSEMAKKVFSYKVSQSANDRITVIGNAGTVGRKSVCQGDQNPNNKKFSEDVFAFLVVGSIDARKNQIGIVRALDIVRYLINEPIVLILVGAITDHEYSKKLNTIIAERNLQNEIIFEGYTEHVTDLMHTSDALIVDSYFEGWSMAATEALYCGLPIIHSECGSGKELVADGKNGILISNPIKNITSLSSAELYDKMHMGISENIAQLVAAMISMLENKKIWKNRSGEIKKYAQTNFTSDNMMQEYLRIYSEAYYKSIKK